MSEDDSEIAEAVEEFVKRKRERQSQKPKHQPRYNVILWDDMAGRGEEPGARQGGHGPRGPGDDDGIHAPG